jgi:DNA-binding MarR family transcriptional regulator
MPKQEPPWTRVLLALYENNMEGDSFDDYGYSMLLRKVAIREELDAEASDVSSAIRQLKKLDLIREPSAGRRQDGYQLTKRGFDVAHEIESRRRSKRREREQKKRQHSTNRAIGLLTLGLVLVGLIQASITAAAGVNSPLWQVNAFLVVGVGTVIGIGWLLYRDRMLSA